MALRRAGLSLILIKRYRYFFLIAIILFTLQAFISFSLLNLNSNFESKSTIIHSTIRKDVFKGHTYENLITNYKIKKKAKCPITKKDMLHALKRVNLESCKRELITKFCEHLNGTLFPSTLKRTCDIQPQHKRGEYLGCFRDYNRKRIFKEKPIISKDNNVESCLLNCLQLGFRYSGVEYGNECRCSDNLPTEIPIADSECEMSCPKLDTRKCGGFFTMSIYSTGLPSIKDVLKRKREMSLNDTTKDVRIVFALTVNGRSFRQVKRLLKALYDANHYYFIHVDSVYTPPLPLNHRLPRHEYLHRMTSALIHELPNVRMSINRFSSIWGGASLLQMHLGCLKELLSIDEWHWDFFINLSESDMPIRSVNWLTKYMNKHRNSNFVKSHGSKADSFIKKQGLDYLFVECANRMWRINNRKLPTGVWIDGGSDWLGLNREFASYVVNSEDDLVSGLKAYWKYSLLASESFFHTVLHNSRFCMTIINNNLHLTNWKRAQGCKCQYKKVVDWCGCSPNDFMPDDIKRIKTISQSKKPIFFARKFEAIVNNEIINKLVDHLNNKDNDDPAYSSYWQNEYHHEDKNTKVSDSFMTHYSGLVRLSLRMLSDNYSGCDSVTMKSVLRRVTVYNHEDVFRGFVMTFAPSDGNSDSELESLVEPIDAYEVIENEGIVNRLVHLQVGTMYDMKEEIFRNMGNFLCIGDTPVLRHEWSRGVAGQVTFSVHNPSGEALLSHKLIIPKSTYHVDHYDIKLQQSLTVGTWSIKLFFNDNEVARTTFLVLPISRRIRSEFGDRIIDELLSQHWKVSKACVTVSNGCYGKKLPSCASTNWSTHFPDPKSTFEVGELSTQDIKHL